ncbi:hypothetical protein AB434_1469 [Heyndrickxia coagulans]|uniref:Uncharacterized protein n=1 Tax=Heyndrickxia coagulans TaxID=1398 RepID=A0AAN0WDI0_HEYCO|nr:hypothetical protein SB48_HM08orf06163 [Heyndrickxia coagulans]AKN53874.1 hypothetical protein AB434_1469 [Heyndrickxia coagulans]KYC60637.1 hypothetical protein B4100_1127 [Heyndrickxia coagulans]KYC89144.1 hypothetical protein B4096_1066 [Heyndrickxia coagulans]
MVENRHEPYASRMAFTTMPGMGTMDMMMALHVMSPLKKI